MRAGGKGNSQPRKLEVLATSAPAASVRETSGAAATRPPVSRADEAFPVDTGQVLRTLMQRYSKGKQPIAVSFRDLVPWIRMGERATHHIHTYPAKLLPQIAHFFLATTTLVGLEETVLDPFGGTGTVALESVLSGRNAYYRLCGAPHKRYDVAWAQSYTIGVDYTPSATRAGNAVFNRHRAPTSRLTRLLAHIPNIRAAAFWQSSTEIGVEGACIIATSTTAETSMAALSWNGLNGITPTARGLLLNPNRGIGFVVQTTHAKEFALAHWLVGGADGGRLCLRCFDGAGIVRENIAGDALASGTTLQWAPTSKTWQAGAVMQESDLNRRQTVRFGPEVAFAQIGIVGFDGQIELEALRLYGLPEDAPAILFGCPALPAGSRTLMFSASWDLPSMPPGATSNADVTVPGARRGDFADASLDTSSIAFVLDCHVWSNDKVRVTARNVSLSTVDLPAAALHVQVVKRRVG